MSSNTDSSGADGGLPRKRQKLSNSSKDDAGDPALACFPDLNPDKAQEQPQRDVSCDSTDGLKSAVGGMEIDSTTDERAHASDATPMGNKDPQMKVTGLRLEAIFHPKFDNENRTTADIRNRMLERVAQSRGYLEVSLKHSGSLLLWSGCMRYYSKNSTDNRFAHAGEIILRQHFARAWNEDDTNQNDVAAESKYKVCSDVVESLRLTLSFEVVTSVLGQHGDISNRDFLILTAIADRSSEGGRGRSSIRLNWWNSPKDSDCRTTIFGCIRQQSRATNFFIYTTIQEKQPLPMGLSRLCQQLVMEAIISKAFIRMLCSKATSWKDLSFDMCRMEIRIPTAKTIQPVK